MGETTLANPILYDNTGKINICYPTTSTKKCIEIKQEIKNIGLELTNFIFYKKGTDSIILLNKKNYTILKISRTDANIDLSNEGEILFIIMKQHKNMRMAPNVYLYSRNLILMEYIKGQLIDEVINKRDFKNIKKIICPTVKKAFLLDMLHIDHGELSRLYKHLIITNDNEPVFIDFGRGSRFRKTRNLSSVISFFYNLNLKFEIETNIENPLMLPNKGELLFLLKKYKKNKEDGTKIVQKICEYH